MFKTKTRSVLVRLTSLAAAIAMIWLCVLPVSASEQITLLDWGWGYDMGYSSVPTSCYLMHDPANAFTYRYQKVVINMFGLDAKQGYTYTYTNTFQLRGSQTGYYTTSGDQLNTVGYVYDLGNGTNDGQNKTINYQGSLQTVSVSISKISEEGTTNTYRLKVIYNVDKAGTQPGNIFLFTNVFKKNDNTDHGLTLGNEILTCVKDLDGTVFEQSLINEVAAMRQENSEYFTNALEVLDNIKANGEATNEKLDQMPGKIGDELDKHDDKVKQEAGTEGNDNINQATSALTNALPIASISDAIAPLITACSYNGITSVWTFPAMKIPAIAGLFNEMQLNDAQNFDLCNYAEQYIPDELLTLIRAVTTVLLIIWAIREIMSLLSNFLGGGNNVGSG